MQVTESTKSANFRTNVSEIESYINCPTRWYFQRWHGREPRFPAVALVAGILWHRFLERLLNGMDRQDSLGRMEDEAEVEIKIREEFERDAAAKQIRFELKRLFLAALEWKDQYEFDTLEVEGPMSCEIHIPDWNGSLTLDGTPDRIVRHQGQIWHMQHRTLAEGVNRENYNTALVRDMHETLYGHMIMESYPDEKYGGTCMDVLRKTSLIRFRAQPSAFMYQDFVPISKFEIETGVQNIIAWASLMRMTLSGEIRMPNNPKIDLGIYRNSYDPYLDVFLDGGMDRLNDDHFFRDVKRRYA